MFIEILQRQSYTQNCATAFSIANSLYGREKMAGERFVENISNATLCFLFNSGFFAEGNDDFDRVSQVKRTKYNDTTILRFLAKSINSMMRVARFKNDQCFEYSR